MSKIRIKNFGPIKEGFKDADGNEWMDVKKVTVFIGNQGSGKSTVAKVISTVTWIEKALNRGDFDTFHLTKVDFFELFEYQRIHSYFKEDTVIEYLGDRASIKFDNRHAHPWFELREGSNYITPQIMYVPAERNFLSTVQNAFDVKGLPGSLSEFAEQVKKAQFALNGSKLDLPISDLQFRYDKRKDESYLVGKSYEINLLEASSGYQSIIPLYLVTKFLSDYISKGSKTLREQLSPSQSVRRNAEITQINLDDTLSDKERQKKINSVDFKFLSKCLINIVEEPEQNLFPSSQQQLLNSLLEFNNMHEGNKLLMTTHSPYLINYLTLAVEAGSLNGKIESDKVKEEVHKIVPLNSTIDSHDLVIYEFDETDGTIKILGNYRGLPSDENKLNDELGEGNELFAKLLEIGQKL